MTLDAWLPGRTRWMTSPALWGLGAAGAFAAQYVLFTVELTAAGRALLPLLAAVTGVVALGGVHFAAGRSLPRLRALAAASQARRNTDVLAALAEARQAPERVATLGAVAWGAAVLAIALLLKGLTGGSWTAAGRLVLAGVYLGPAAVLLAAALVSRRANEVVARLAQEVHVRDVLPVLSAQRLGVRGRLAWFTVAMVAFPVALLADVGAHLSTAAVEATTAAPAAQRALVAAAVEQELGLKLLWLCLFALGLAVAAAWAGATVVAGPLQQVAEDASRIAAGELGRAALVPGEAEAWRVTSVFSDMKERLVELVGQLHGAGRQVTTAAQALHETTLRYEAGAAEQAAALNQTSATTEELAHSARQIAANATSVLDLAQRTLDAAEGGQATASSFQAAVERMRQDNRSIAGAVERLARRVQQIGRIVEVINSVADRSDLLALSAELEGTRAGEVGRGFSLVSTEMRRLAENVLESTAEVEELITEIREATRSTAEATAHGSALTESSTSLADEVTRALGSVSALARETSNAVRTISMATQQQQTGTDQLAEAMSDILAVTQQGLAATRQLATANERLQGLSGTLKSVVGRFRIVT